MGVRRAGGLGELVGLRETLVVAAIQVVALAALIVSPLRQVTGATG